MRSGLRPKDVILDYGLKGKGLYGIPEKLLPKNYAKLRAITRNFG